MRGNRWQWAATGHELLEYSKVGGAENGSVAIAANPPAVGVNTWPPEVAVSEMPWRSKFSLRRKTICF